MVMLEHSKVAKSSSEREELGFSTTVLTGVALGLWDLWGDEKAS